MSCDFAHHDGAYVLGALSPAERQEFERHLDGCAACARATRELAGLPGLLARVDPDVLESAPHVEPVPETLLPALVHEVRRTRKRRRFLTAGLAAAAVVALGVGSLAVTGVLDGDGTPAALPPPPGATLTLPAGQEMLPVGRTTVRASVALERVPWGTRLSLTCTYTPGESEYGLPHAATYALVVRTRDGATEQVATWRALPGRTMQLAAATASGRPDIASVEMRTAEGEPVLRLAR
ncbi:zf-HC2 domain-containing protein [Nocardioides sp. WL0053]|uniref:Zf-HC2 domain-containing protein n=1 Tax=Nocardioides jiangsuensis TaxID=2866161 RepID=A0ABS7RI18_9ACTN|nr:zf-HC2 domain-containing protein [Nocardioides jiangsuensis]MBY9073237.1 zf-HC2 domain-containing protein [Nocardioides jiangsuensis]